MPRAMLPMRSSSESIRRDGRTRLYIDPYCWNLVVTAGGIPGQVASRGIRKEHNGTGFGFLLLLNTGSEPVASQNGLLTTIGWQLGDEVTYCLEGSVFVAGAVVQWLRDGLGLIENSSAVEALARQVDSTDGVYFVPAFTGLGAPYWKSDARGTTADQMERAQRGLIWRELLWNQSPGRRATSWKRCSRTAASRLMSCESMVERRRTRC